MSDLNPTTELEFCYSWRPYQRRVLAAIDLHLADRKLHIVAAPGAGKTTLGLEVFRRLGRRCLVLSPTRVIRDQWIERLRDFVPESRWPLSWTSVDLDDPGFLTSITYQALHTRYREAIAAEDADEADIDGDEEAPSANDVDGLIEHMHKAQIDVLILDEAHHLRSEWWKALNRVTEHFEELTLLALTATPPYDVTNHEWSKYQSLCGPIDEEISIPELVQAGTLCPHQDFVWTVTLSESKREQLQRYDESVSGICEDLGQSPVFLSAVSSHPWLDPAEFVELEILDNPELMFALLIFLKSIGTSLPKSVLSTLEVSAEELPRMNRRWWQVLVHAFLFHPSFALEGAPAEFRDSLAKRLRSQELLSRRELRLNQSGPIRRMLATASEKIEACLDIHRLESEIRGESLRQVILTDYIRDEQGTESLRQGTESLGAWPIVREFLRRGDIVDGRHIALLTGRLVVLHRSHAAEIEKLLEGERLELRPAPFHPDFVVLAASLQRLTYAFTVLLGQGKIRLLVGTRALLGEGWDAPAVNSLVLASFVGSFMLTNQMRGRAIRIDHDRPDKVASIWHIVAVEDKTITGLCDLYDLRDRFATFVGLHVEEDRIEGGVTRLRLPIWKGFEQAEANILEMGHVRKFVYSRASRSNEEMRHRLDTLPLDESRWRTATSEGLEQRTVPSVQTEPIESFKTVYFRNTLKSALWTVLVLFISPISIYYHSVSSFGFAEPAIYLFGLGLSVVVGLVWSLPTAIKSFRLWWRHLPVDGSIRQIALALRDALSQSDLIRTDPRRLSVVCDEVDGEVTVALGGASFYEQSLFADSLNELLGPIVSPRYLITRKARRKVDYHAVPSMLAARKKTANLLYQAWLTRVGPGELIYTRESGGRQILLRARARTFANNYVNRTERVDRWQ